MKIFSVIIFVCFILTSLYGCGKKQTETEEFQEPLSMEELSLLGNATYAQAPASTPQGAPEAVLTPAKPMTELKLEPLPPSGPYKPTSREIQSALKNAGYYKGAVDGKIGPMSKKAIEDFQRDKGLVADGKVGLKTWAALQKYLSFSVGPAPSYSKER